MAANRSHGFIRGFCANAQTSIRRSGSVARSKRRRTEENVELSFERSPFESSQSLFSAGAEVTPFDNELYSFLFDHDNRCTIFDDEPGIHVPPELPLSVDESATWTQLNNTPTSLPGNDWLSHGNDAAELFLGPSVFDSELFSRSFEPNNIVRDEPRKEMEMDVPTMEMKRCKLSPSVDAKSEPKPALVQVNITPTPPEKMRRAPSTVTTVSDVPMTTRNRPFKNVRERRRRAQMKNKFMQLYNLCCSKKVTSVAAMPDAEATGLLIPISGHGGAHTPANNEPSKVEVLVAAIRAFEALDKELTDLRTRNGDLVAQKKSLSTQLH